MPRDRVLVEEGEIAYDIAASMLLGNYERGDRIIYDAVVLTPALDYQTIFRVNDRKTDTSVGVVNADAVATARELVATIEAVVEAGEVVA